MKELKKYLIWFLVLVYVSGAIGFLINPGFFLPFTPYNLILTAFVFMLHQPFKQRSFVLSFAAIAVIGFIAEIIGVNTGLVFGNYSYGGSLGYKIMGVPLLISVNWALLVCAAVIIVSKIVSNIWILSLVSSLFITAIDLLIEQVAFKLDFWRFSSGIAGLHNYIGWLVLSFFLSLSFAGYIRKGEFSSSLIIIFLQLFFFGFIYLFS